MEIAAARTPPVAVMGATTGSPPDGERAIGEEQAEGVGKTHGDEPDQLGRTEQHGFRDQCRDDPPPRTRQLGVSQSIRSSLLTLQNTAEMQTKVQERLATGKKVNSALDNPTNFFTAAA